MTDVAGPDVTPIGSGLAKLDGYPFEVRYSEGSLLRARVAAEITTDAYHYLGQLFSGFKPDIALIVANHADWRSRQPYGLPFFNDDEGQICQGIVVMPAGSGDFWVGMGQDLRETSPKAYPKLLATYPDGDGGLDLQPFFDLITIHELGHAYETLGGLQLPTFWLGEIFANLTLHTFVSSRQPENLNTLETLSSVGAESTQLTARMRTEGFTTLEDLEANYTGGDNPMNSLNYIWYQYRWQRIAAAMFKEDGEDGLVRFWNYFRTSPRLQHGEMTTSSLASLLRTEVSEILGSAIQEWR
jgi:hypothetical protein